MKSILSILSFSILLSIASCSTRDDDASVNDIDCLNLAEQELVLTIQESFTTLPAQVSVFFKVNENDGSAVPNLTAANFTIVERGRNDACYQEISSLEASASIAQEVQNFTNTIYSSLQTNLVNHP